MEYIYVTLALNLSKPCELRKKEEMARISTFQTAHAKILETFSVRPERVFSSSEIENMFSQNRTGWGIAGSKTVADLINYLVEKGDLKKIPLKFPSRNIVRYSFGDVSAEEVALSLKPRLYFTHYTAMFLNNLTEQIPKTIYVNCEQEVKTMDITLPMTQETINRAFKAKPRTTNNIAEYHDLRIALLYGKYTNQLGVTEVPSDYKIPMRVTNIERTLIDITVRPFYSGGVWEVLKAFANAREKVSVNRLSSILANLSYKYPYHQAIGFYMERTGVYKESQLNLMRKFPITYDFFLTYKMVDMDYSKKWHLYFPNGL